MGMKKRKFALLLQFASVDGDVNRNLKTLRRLLAPWPRRSRGSAESGLAVSGIEGKLLLGQTEIALVRSTFREEKK
jgi:hypothetical protein